MQQFLNNQFLKTCCCFDTEMMNSSVGLKFSNHCFILGDNRSVVHVGYLRVPSVLRLGAYSDSRTIQNCFISDWFLRAAGFQDLEICSLFLWVWEKVLWSFFQGSGNSHIRKKACWTVFVFPLLVECSLLLPASHSTQNCNLDFYAASRY